MKKILAVWLLSIAALSLYGTSKQEYPLLLDSITLEEALQKEDIVLVDIGRKPEDFETGHIPGAVYFSREKIWTEVDGVKGMFPGVEEAVAALEEAGISNDSTVVVYDGNGELWASRLFWTLEYLGHDKVHLLDGGIQGWTDAGLELSSEINLPSRGSFTAEVQPELLVSSSQLVDSLGQEDLVVVDTRSAGEYNGSDVRAARGGHIPGAVHIEWVQNVSDDSSKYFLSAEELGELYSVNGVVSDKSVVTLCQTGVRGAHTYFVLRNLGYEDVALYDGSWADWGNDSSLPVEVEAQ